MDPSPDIAHSSQGTTTRPLIVASNRLPVSLTASDEGWKSIPSAGGLASALGGLSTGPGFEWIGWPGTTIPPKHRSVVRDVLAADGLVPVFLKQQQELHYYHGFCNAVLWPLFHYFTDHVHFDPRAWDHYVDVNRLFTEAILTQITDDTRVWIHDFHLMLVPAMLRARKHDLEIGFFLHVPFPSSEIYRLLPNREDLLLGMLGADYIGFHTTDYVHHFRTSCLRVLGTSSSPDAINHEGRRIGIGADPIGIDAQGFLKTLSLPATKQLMDQLEERYGDRKLILGVERLDYTKGVPLKFRAFERFLERDPSRASDVTMLQIMVPSRLQNPDYQRLKSEIEEHVGRLNGTYGGPGVTPVEYMYRHLTPEQLVSLYRFAHVNLVTPIRDGMNLVAQEFALCQGTRIPGLKDGRGILVLSEFAGSAHSLSRAILVNPWNIDLTADALETALAMSDGEKQERMEPMAELVTEMDADRWARTYLQRLGQASQRSQASQSTLLRGDCAESVVQQFVAAPVRHLFLDYDGTLREFTRSPEEAVPSQEIVELLQNLIALPDTHVHIVSGRQQKDLDTWFGHLHAHLCAEHGYLSRTPDGSWSHMRTLDLSWMPSVCRTLEEVTFDVPGTRLEKKNCALAWHYRMSELDYGVWRARELLSTLEEDLANQPVEVIAGQQVIEVRAAGVNKGRYVASVMSAIQAEDFILCIGDDRTDLDMYRALPGPAVTVHVDGGAEEARFTLESPARVRAFLHRLIENGSRQLEAAGG